MEVATLCRSLKRNRPRYLLEVAGDQSYTRKVRVAIRKSSKFELRTQPGAKTSTTHKHGVSRHSNISPLAGICAVCSRCQVLTGGLSPVPDQRRLRSLRYCAV